MPRRSRCRCAPSVRQCARLSGCASGAGPPAASSGCCGLSRLALERNHVLGGCQYAAARLLLDLGTRRTSAPGLGSPLPRPHRAVGSSFPHRRRDGLRRPARRSGRPSRRCRRPSAHARHTRAPSRSGRRARPLQQTDRLARPPAAALATRSLARTRACHRRRRMRDVEVVALAEAVKRRLQQLHAADHAADKIGRNGPNRSAADVAGGGPSPGADVAGVGPVPVQMWQDRPGPRADAGVVRMNWLRQSQCRCGRAGPSPGADVAGGGPSPGADVAGWAQSRRRCAAEAAACPST